jgi:nucleoside-diphosphate-sugar epimerase
VEALLKHKEAFYLGHGDNIRAVTHIDDVVDLFMLILEGAIEDNGKVSWGKEVCAFISLPSKVRLTLT